MHRSFFCDTALLPDGWRRNVRIETTPDGLIGSVTADAAPLPGDERAALVVPGMPNVHSHAFQRALAGLTERAGPRGTDDFWSWRELMYHFLARLEADDLEAIAAYAYADMLEAGFTSVGEFHYLHRTPAAELYADPAELAVRHLAAAGATGIGLTLVPVLYEASDFGGVPPIARQRRFVTDLDTFSAIVERLRACLGRSIAPPGAADGGGSPDANTSRQGRSIDPALRAVGIAPHSLRAVTPDALAALRRLYLHEVCHIHAAEQMKEVKDCVAWSGQRPVEWLLEHAGIDSRWCIVHATHLVPSEIDGLARSGAVAGLCPITEANLGDGVFPAIEYVRAGGRWGIGTDSNVSLDSAGELRQLEYSQRLEARARSTLATLDRPSTGRRLFDAALAGGAQALDQRVGSIAPGFRADLVVLDDSHPDLAGRSGDAVLDTWIFSTGRALVRAVIVDGERVVDDTRHRDRDRIDREYRLVAERLLR